MNKGLCKIDEALLIGNKELASLQSGEIEKAEEYSIRRAKLLREAGQFYQADVADNFKSKLIDMHGLQLKLTASAKKLYASMQEEFKEGKEHAKMKRQYSKAMTSGSPTIPIYMDRTS